MVRCVISQRYWKMKAIHNQVLNTYLFNQVVLYLKDTEKWKQFTTTTATKLYHCLLCYISKILKNESNSQLNKTVVEICSRCVISQRYWKMKAIHNWLTPIYRSRYVVLYLKDTEKWKQFTTMKLIATPEECCVISQRYWKMKAIHNVMVALIIFGIVVLYLKDTEKWKQFTTMLTFF